MTPKETPNYNYINREESWLQFNARVLQEAADLSVPIIERLRFLGIFSNNLDEFFKVRYATIKRIVEAGKGAKSELGGVKANELLERITKIVIKQQQESFKILEKTQKQLEKENIFIIDETEVDATQTQFIKNYFLQKVSPALVTLILNDLVEIPNLKDSAAYLAVTMQLQNNEKQYALIEISKEMDRFVVLPEKEGKHYIILVDDVIRMCLDEIFTIFNYTAIRAHMIKITRDAELDFDSDLSKSFIEKISDSVKDRQIGDPVRFVYDKSIDSQTLQFLMNKMKIDNTDSIIPGGRYHNRRDYMDFPSLGRTDLLYSKIEALPIKNLSLQENIFTSIAKKDFLLYTPYHTFSYVIKFLREAALDPQVKSIKITIYRLAKNSQIVSALINAAKNGKKVTATIELQARFDEQANIDYAEQMQQEGITIIFGVPGLKVHSKICVIERLEGKKTKRYGFVSTGNFNESTSKVYTDFTLLTANQKILKDLQKVFVFFNANYRVFQYKHIITSPHYTKSVFFRLIQKEIDNAKAGKPAYIHLKMNSISNYEIIDKLYEASQAGVTIKMIVRGICCLIAGESGYSENIATQSIIDKFLEHTRLYIFCNENDPKVYISSADWMTRNIENRVEVSCPIYQEEVKQELLDIFEICWNDSSKSRILDATQNNNYKKKKTPKIRAQFETYNYYLKKLE